jgi:hypothetical protein
MTNIYNTKKKSGNPVFLFGTRITKVKLKNLMGQYDVGLVSDMRAGSSPLVQWGEAGVL